MYKPKLRSTRTAINFDSLSDATGEFERLSQTDDTGNQNYGRVLRTQTTFMQEVLGIFRAYDEERREDAMRMAALETKVNITAGIAGAVSLLLLGVLVKLALLS